MEEEVKYTSEFDGQTTDEVLEHAKSVKDLTIPSLSEISGFVCINKEGNAIGMMSKEQVAQVVGGLIGLATSNKNGLVSKDWCFPKGGIVTPDQNIDNLEAGIYSVGAGNTNVPGSTTGVLFVDINLAYNYRIQRFYDTKGNKLVRINSGSWSTWK